MSKTLWKIALPIAVLILIWVVTGSFPLFICALCPMLILLLFATSINQNHIIIAGIVGIVIGLLMGYVFGGTVWAFFHPFPTIFANWILQSILAACIGVCSLIPLMQEKRAQPQKTTMPEDTDMYKDTWNRTKRG